mgnify:CR=1 FL=1
MLQQYLPFTVLKLTTILVSPQTSSNFVATVPTVYGIETLYHGPLLLLGCELQQYLPFTVLKRPFLRAIYRRMESVATVPTVYGIETLLKIRIMFKSFGVATVPTVYGIETKRYCVHVMR